MLNPVYIQATTLSDAWFQTIFKIIESGRVFKIDEGSYHGQKRLEFDYLTVQITHPETIPLLPKLNPALGIPDPVAEEYIDEYLPYLMTDAKKEGESYTYGSRITDVSLKEVDMKFVKSYVTTNQNDFLDQMELMIYTYKNKGYRNNQMVLQVAQPSDMLLVDPPCLRAIDSRIQDGKLHFFPYFRSWDIFSGMPANLAAIEMMKQYCADAIGVENGEIIASSKGAHSYGYTWDIIEKIRGKKIEDLTNQI